MTLPRETKNFIGHDTLARLSDNIAIVSANGEQHSYGALLAYTERLAERLEPRALVFCLAQNSVGSLVGYLSCMMNGTVPLLLNDHLNPELLDNLMALYRPQYLWVPQDNIHTAESRDSVVEMLGYSLIRLSDNTGYPLHPDLGLLLTTSGSTGSPKLVRLTYENLRANAESIAEYLSIDSSERPITALPMNYTFGLSIINSHLIRGATILLTNRSLMEREFWAFLKQYKATSLSGIPYSFEILKKLHFFDMDLPHLRTLTQAGGKLNDDLNRQVAEFCRKAGKRFFVMYGQTEATARMSYLPHEKSIGKLGSMGVAIQGGAFSLIDEDGNTIDKSDTVGELVYRGKNVSMGYAVCGDDLTKEDENEGVLVTGDLATCDEDGFYYIVGRKKRFIKLFGNRVNLDATEQLLKGITPDCACTGNDDRMLIYITNEDLTKEVRHFVAEKTGIHPSAFDVRCIDAIPKSSSGKTIYTALAV
ncbi:MAG: AMP-binding protein [Verrucomicrobia bacterium]|jgi:long-chain acyl-CoA synthetase|nr:AMP-binding protein [Verrucomicrobiota bacterium]MBT7066320.1 AMP-binding protein [Verrucomicrobiota bacterium]MBT7699278.1 AMP-binding protein [Verrucomicrobiota bacterium]